MRKHLAEYFDLLFHVHLEGNVRHNPTLAGSTYNVFGIQVGVGITLAVRKAKRKSKDLLFCRVDKFLRREEKLAWLERLGSVGTMPFHSVVPTSTNVWLPSEFGDEFDQYLPIASKDERTLVREQAEVVFNFYSLGVNTARDSNLYAFSRSAIVEQAEACCDAFNTEVDRYARKGRPKDVDAFVDYDSVKWSSTLKQHLKRGEHAKYNSRRIRNSLYRPFTKQLLYYDEMLIDRPGWFRVIFPTRQIEADNQVLYFTAYGSERPFMAGASNHIIDLHSVGAGSGAVCFPFHLYTTDGKRRRENITDWALKHFRDHYQDKKITKWDVFYYVYGILHHPGYRTKFADNLKRELPRIPLAPDFKAFAKAGKKLAELHLNYESLEPWPLEWLETEGVPLSYHVEKMRLSKDKTQLKVNDSLTLANIPPAVFDYRLGNRSALDWVIDQYQISTDKHSGIVSDPNNPDDEEYIVRLIGQVVRVSVETVKIVNSLPAYRTNG